MKSIGNSENREHNKEIKQNHGDKRIWNQELGFIKAMGSAEKTPYTVIKFPRQSRNI